jgi:FkbM family methyltransferase
MKSIVLAAMTTICPSAVRYIKRSRAQRVAYSQFGEDLVLSTLLSDVQKGFYVDCGAFDPFIFSNTALFYEREWHGINIEPQRSRWQLFNALRPRDINLCEVISSSDGDVDFIEAATPTLSGITESGSCRGTQGSMTRRKARRLSAILQEHAKDTHIDFLTVDCEGHDLSVLQSNNWSQFRPSFVLAEDHDRNNASPLAKFMTELGYTQIFKLGPTRIFQSA